MRSSRWRLAAIGSFGVLSYSVAQRTREIGVRMAIGADRTDILTLVLRQAAKFTAIGIAAGLIAALVVARLFDSLFFETTATDALSPSPHRSRALVFVTLIAVIIPAGRAASVNPVEALALRVAINSSAVA